MAEDRLPFSMRWSVSPSNEETIRFSQVVEVDSLEEPLFNHFSLSSLNQNKFTIALENNLVGQVVGQGLFDEKMIAWEFRKAEEGFEGYEIYELQPSGSYKMRAEFMGGDDIRTFVSGIISPIS